MRTVAADQGGSGKRRPGRQRGNGGWNQHDGRRRRGGWSWNRAAPSRRAAPRERGALPERAAAPEQARQAARRNRRVEQRRRARWIGRDGHDGGAVPLIPLLRHERRDDPGAASDVDTTPVLLRGADLADDGTSLVPRALYDGWEARPAILGPHPQASDKRTPSPRRGAFRSLRSPAARRVPGRRGRADAARVPAGRGGLAQDAGFHAFYTIRNDEIAGAVGALRELADRPAPKRRASCQPRAHRGQSRAVRDQAPRVREAIRRRGPSGSPHDERATRTSRRSGGSFAASRRGAMRSSTSRSWARPRSPRR